MRQLLFSVLFLFYFIFICLFVSVGSVFCLYVCLFSRRLKLQSWYILEVMLFQRTVRSVRISLWNHKYQAYFYSHVPITEWVCMKERNELGTNEMMLLLYKIWTHESPYDSNWTVMWDTITLHLKEEVIKGCCSYTIHLKA